MKTIGSPAGPRSGKTTLIEKLIPLFARRGLRVSLIKHAHHTFDVDQPGKDFIPSPPRRARARCSSLRRGAGC
jgi:molybdopterin-guanine dinucleotide biosynthesis protein